jgi:hypothetical protein
VHDVDPRLIERTQQWLAGAAAARRKLEAGHQLHQRRRHQPLQLRRAADHRLTSPGRSKIPAIKGPAVEKAKGSTSRAAHLNGKADAYTLAVLANFAADYGKDREFTRQAMHCCSTRASRKTSKPGGRPKRPASTATGASASRGDHRDWPCRRCSNGAKRRPPRKGARYIASKKDAAGTWGTTQATIMALRALLLSTGERRGRCARHGGDLAERQAGPETGAHAGEQRPAAPVRLQGVDGAAAQSRGQLRFDGKGGLAYQVVGRYFSRGAKPAASRSRSMWHTTARTGAGRYRHRHRDGRNNLEKSANMVMVDLGIPPGFDLLSEDLQTYQEKSAARKSGRLEKFSLTATQAILYFDSIGAGATRSS